MRRPRCVAGSVRSPSRSYRIARKLCERLTRCLVKGGTGERLDHISLERFASALSPVRRPGTCRIPTIATPSDCTYRREGDLSALYNPDFDLWTILDHTRRQALMWVASDEQIPFLGRRRAFQDSSSIGFLGRHVFSSCMAALSAMASMAACCSDPAGRANRRRLRPVSITVSGLRRRSRS